MAGRSAAGRPRCCWRSAAAARRVPPGGGHHDIFTNRSGVPGANQALPPRHRRVETAAPAHAVRDYISQNLDGEQRLLRGRPASLLFVESAATNGAQFIPIRRLHVYVIDVSGGDKIPRKGGPGITQSDLLVINKTDLAPLVGADLGVMARDAAKMRGDGPVVFAQVTHGVGLDAIVDHLLASWRTATGTGHPGSPARPSVRSSSSGSPPADSGDTPGGLCRGGDQGVATGSQSRRSRRGHRPQTGRHQPGFELAELRPPMKKTMLTPSCVPQPVRRFELPDQVPNVV